jgi:hypothetical protein
VSFGLLNNLPPFFSPSEAGQAPITRNRPSPFSNDDHLRSAT